MADQRCNAHGIYSGEWCQLCGPPPSMIAVDPYDTIKTLEGKLGDAEKEIERWKAHNRQFVIEHDALQSRLSSCQLELNRYIDLALPKVKPSCLVCGRADYDEPAITHMVLGSVVVCESCSSAPRRLGEIVKLLDEASFMDWTPLIDKVHKIAKGEDVETTDQPGRCGAFFTDDPHSYCRLENDHEGPHDMISRSRRVVERQSPIDALTQVGPAHRDP